MKHNAIDGIPRPIFFGKFVSARVYELRAQMNAGKVGESEKAPMLQRLLQYRYSPTNELMPERDIISECMGHLCVRVLLPSMPCASNSLSPLLLQDRRFRYHFHLVVVLLLGA